VHYLNRFGRTISIITGNPLHRLAGDELEIMSCILLAAPNPALTLMAGMPEAETLARAPSVPRL